MATKNLTKAELVDALTAKEVKTTGEETLAELQELATANDVAITKETTPTVTATQKVRVDVVNKQGGFVRSYSLEQHGEDFQDRAAEYAAKIGGSVK